MTRDTAFRPGLPSLAQVQAHHDAQVQARPAPEPVWLTPWEAGIKRREVWTAKTASGAEVQVLLTSHRRAGSVKRAWFGLSLRTKAEVRVVKVLEGSGIGT